MTRIILSGCNGKMGRVVTACVDGRDDCKIVAGVDLNAVMLADYPVYTDLHDITQEADVIIDFSRPTALSGIISFAADKGLACVLATTGYDERQTELIRSAAEKLPVFFSFNMSLGINLLIELAKKATAVLGDSFDIEIVEAHHNQKVDAPSGTAVMLANAVNDSLSEPYELTYDRHSLHEARQKKEIGMHSVRGGTIVGEHEVIFAGRDEVVKLSHSAHSKEIFAVGAVKAAIFVAKRPAGLYSMSDMLK